MEQQSPALIGVCLSTIQDENRFNFIKALNKYAVSGGYRLLVFNACNDLSDNSDPNSKGESAVFRLIPYDKLSALVMMSGSILDKTVVSRIVTTAQEHGVPVISIGSGTDDCINMSFSDSDTFERIVRHVIEAHGAHELYMIAGVKNEPTSDERIAAFRRALDAYNIEFNENNIGYGNLLESSTTDLLTQWFVTEHRPVPDAIICVNDPMAVVTSIYIQRLGCSVPDDCIITGFDSTMQTEFYLPHLTTCRRNYNEMGKRLIDMIVRLGRGEQCSSGTIDFNIKLSQSCGCEKIDRNNVNDAMRAVLNRLKQSSLRQNFMCEIQSSVSNADDIKSLPHILMDKFSFSTCLFALNTDIFEPPFFGEQHDSESPFTENISVLCQRYHWDEQPPCNIRLNELLPDFQTITKRPEPIILCCLHSIGKVLGYCAFQPRIDFDDYEKMHTLMNALNSSLGTFHSKMHVQYTTSELMQLNEKLRVSSLHDFMTGLFNRRGFYAETQKLITSDQVKKEMQIALVFADLDGLKHINDSFGHNEGDNAIITLGHALLSSAFRGEICARFGGDEFCTAVLIPQSQAESYCTRFRKDFSDYLRYYNESSGKPYKVETSMGFYLHPVCSDIDLEELVNTADKLMYEEKMMHKAMKQSLSS